MVFEEIRERRRVQQILWVELRTDEGRRHASKAFLPSWLALCSWIIVRANLENLNGSDRALADPRDHAVMSRGNTSSQSRVAPIFNWLLQSDPTGQRWLAPLLRLPRRTSFAPPSFDPGVLRETAWIPKERGLQPPRELLQHLVARGTTLRPKRGRTRASEDTEALRDKLLGGDAETIREATALLEQPTLPRKAWYILEGPTWPDVYLRTDRLVIVIEGKNEEPEHTTRTDWMEVRYQMLRHIDGAWPKTAADPPVVGFYVVEAEPGSTKVPDKWLRFSDETVSEHALVGSLPHRSAEERAAFAESFLGVTTWQTVCEALGIPSAVLR